MRQLVLSPRWIKWHVLTLGAMITCGLLAAWQWQRAGSALGSALNVGYGLQWPVFAIFFGVMWWRMLRMEATRLAEVGGSEDGGDPVGGELTAPAGVPVPSVPVPPVPAGPSPFGPRPVSRPVTAARPAQDDDPELADYNRMLAELAARHPED